MRDLKSFDSQRTWQIGDVFIISSWLSSSSGTKPLPPHVGHRRSSSVPFSTTPSPLQSGQVFMRASFTYYHAPLTGARPWAAIHMAVLFAGASPLYPRKRTCGACHTSMRSIKVGSSPAAFELFTLRDTGYIWSDL